MTKRTAIGVDDGGNEVDAQQRATHITEAWCYGRSIAQFIAPVVRDNGAKHTLQVLPTLTREDVRYGDATTMQ